MVYNANFNNISAISSVLLVEETGEHEENNRPAVSHCQTLSHNVDRNRVAQIYLKFSSYPSEPFHFLTDFTITVIKIYFTHLSDFLSN